MDSHVQLLSDKLNEVIRKISCFDRKELASQQLILGCIYTEREEDISRICAMAVLKNITERTVDNVMVVVMNRVFGGELTWYKDFLNCLDHTVCGKETFIKYYDFQRGSFLLEGVELERRIEDLESAALLQLNPIAKAKATNGERIRFRDVQWYPYGVGVGKCIYDYILSINS